MPWGRVLLAKRTSSELQSKYPGFYGTWRFITAFRTPAHVCLPWTRSIQPMPLHSTSWRLSSLLCLNLPSGLIPSGVSTKTLCTLTSTLPHMCYMPPQPHSSQFDHLNNIGWGVQIVNLLSTIFSNTLSLHSAVTVNDQVSHPYKTTGQIIALYILNYTFLDSKLEDKRFCTEW